MTEFIMLCVGLYAFNRAMKYISKQKDLENEVCLLKKEAQKRYEKEVEDDHKWMEDIINGQKK